VPLISTPAIVLASFRYGETSKIIRLASRDHGVQSAIAKGALRPRSRFGGSLQLLSEGQAHWLMKENRELNVLTSFDLRQLHVGLTRDLERYAVACALAEVMLRFAPPDPHPESFEVLQQALALLEAGPAETVESLGFRLLWQLVSSLGFAPSVHACVIDGVLIPPEGHHLCSGAGSHPVAARGSRRSRVAARS
jgi:DNA repair protein RecO (recombination protein O)